jgi:hypothetical protein
MITNSGELQWIGERRTKDVIVVYVFMYLKSVQIPIFYPTDLDDRETDT